MAETGSSSLLGQKRILSLNVGANATRVGGGLKKLALSKPLPIFGNPTSRPVNPILQDDSEDVEGTSIGTSHSRLSVDALRAKLEAAEAELAKQPRKEQASQDNESQDASASDSTTRAMPTSVSVSKLPTASSADDDADIRELDERGPGLSLKQQREQIRAKFELQKIAETFGLSATDLIKESLTEPREDKSVEPSSDAMAASMSSSADREEDELDKYLQTIESEAQAIARADRERLKQLEREELKLLESHTENERASEHGAHGNNGEGAAASGGEYSTTPYEDGPVVVNERIFDDENDLGAEDYEQSTGSDALTWLERQALAKNRKDLKPVDHSTIDYIPFRKNFYTPHPEVAALTEEDVARIREEKLGGIRVRGIDVPKPVTKWVHCGFPLQVDELLARRGFAAPFPIQAQVLPVIMSGRDCLVCAQTGSGKTLAFVLPMIRHVLDQPPLAYGEGPIGLVLAPIRELAVQIAHEIQVYSLPFAHSTPTKHTGGVLKVNACYGGAPISEQIARLRGGSQVVVGTPGRLIDLLTANGGKVMNLRRVTYLVLDEADRMFDMGFKPQIMRIVVNIRPDRQTLLFSATFPPAVEQLAKQILVKPVEVVLGGRSVASSTITQLVEIVPEEEKFKRLLEILRKWYSPDHNILIFANKKEQTDQLQKKIAEVGYASLALHGNMDQMDRDHTLQMFRSKLRTIMIATSIVARGLDVKDLKLVINYSAPNHYEDYVHRIGRTGRAGERGTAITFLTPEEEQVSLDLVKGMQAAKQPVPADLKQMAEAFKEKVRKKEATYHHRDGYKTKGFKFDESEDDRRKRIAAAQDEQSEEEELDLEEGERAPGSKKEPASDAGIVVLDAATGRPITESSQTAAPAQPAASVGSTALPSTTASSSSESSTTDQKASAAATSGTSTVSTASLTISQQIAAAMALAQRARELAQRKEETAKETLEKAKAEVVGAVAGGVVPTPAPAKAGDVSQALLAVAASIEQKAGGQGRGAAPSAVCMVELEINDYPQQARWRCTRRETLTDVMEEYGVSVVTKGVYVPPGARVQPDERKLYLQIQGPTPESVRHAAAEIRRRLNAEAEATRDTQPQSAYSKFTI